MPEHRAPNSRTLCGPAHRPQRPALEKRRNAGNPSLPAALAFHTSATGFFENRE
jgi:hypothetical protein